MDGHDIITPLYTHVNSDGQKCGILVNRGWLCMDYQWTQEHYLNNPTGEVQGVLSIGQFENKYDRNTNVVYEQDYNKQFLTDLTAGAVMGNPEDSEKVLLRQVDFDPKFRQILPDAPTPEDLQEFQTVPERHEAYATLWKWATYLNLIANTAFWLSV